ncbi:MAG TPA: transcription elongation factor GreA [Acidimicrobiales bacterium]|nr:transcription elongation factor GreA [Acidimicrobiales bacterium]
MPETHLSQETYERLSAELEHLTTVGRIDIARRIEEARNLGDLSENGDYHAAKDEQGRMEARIRQLQAMLKDVTIVENEGPSDVVKIGSLVTLDFGFGDGGERYLVGSMEEAKGRDDVDEVVTPESPLGQALVGSGPGDVSYEANGRELTVKILEIS